MPGYPFIAAAQTLDSQVQEATNKPLFNTREALLVIGISLAVGLVLFLCVYFKFRKKPGIDFGPRESKHEIPLKRESERSSGRRRKRHQRRAHRPRNPTLDKTGGLPPPRPDGELPKY